MRVVACSPLTKLFLPEWEERLLENPDLITDESVPFVFTVPRSSGAIANVKYGVPFRPDDYLRSITRGRKIDEKEAASLHYYLSGGNDGEGMQETDWTGIVDLEIGGNTTETALSEISQMVMQAQVSGDPKKLAHAEEQMKALLKSSFGTTQEAMKAARKRADARVIKQLRTTHINLLQQYKHNKDDGKGLYTPSTAEHFGAHVLRQIVKVSEGRKKMNAEFNKLINEVWVQQ